MNFKQVVAAAKELSAKKSSGTAHLLGMGIRDMEKWLHPYTVWEEEALTADDIGHIYFIFNQSLQLLGMTMTNGEKAYDDLIWERLTEVLGNFREVVMQNFDIKLPSARVVSLVTEMLENGLLEDVAGDDGQRFVKPKEKLYGLKIKIIKIPDGPAPEAIREKWVGLVLPAEKRSQGEGREYFAVPISIACKSLREISPEGVEWFLNNFGPLGEFTFQTDEAELVP